MSIFLYLYSFFPGWNNSKMTNEIENRRRADAMKFKKAGEGPIPKTYAFDPTKVEHKKAISAKSKS
jgi:YidC/Oxa1 family membrane protein insertase